jgi:hypothetical protein
MRTNELLFISGSAITGSDGNVSGSVILGKWEVDPDDETSIQFRIPKEKFGGNNDRIAFYVSGSGKIGIGTKNPEDAFDVRDIAEDKRDLESDTGDSDNRRENLLKLSRTANNVSVKATALKTARTIGGVSFDGSANIDLPGVNANQTNKSLTWAGTAATATSASYASTGSVLSTARNIGGVSFDGSADINLPGVNTTGNQNTSGTSEFTNLVNSSTAAAKSGLQFTFDSAAGTLTITDKATRTTFTLRKD